MAVCSMVPAAAPCYHVFRCRGGKGDRGHCENEGQVEVWNSLEEGR